ncbi:AmmeMemoRadiSam system protein B [candidate division KSB1 bacterium]|nr:MAG: AmmeMemoRadiSam system protein B [candidate division KSB1 bacterium]
MEAVEGTRKPAVAGMFYPSNPTELKRQIDFFLENLEDNPIDGDIYAIVAPHAGYMYSGQVAAAAYKPLLGRDYDLVAVISPSHREYFDGISVFCGESYETPLGKIPVATEICQRLVDQGDKIFSSWLGHGEEHALEVQLPFLQRVLGDFKLIPVVMGEQNYDYSDSLGETLAKLLRHQQALVVASSDLSHYYPATEAERLDEIVQQRLKDFDYEGLWDDIELRRCEACGAGPIVAAMIAAKKMGANKSSVLMYRHSGDVTGDRTAVVGYLAAAFYKG